MDAQSRREHLLSLLGDLPPRTYPPTSRLVGEEDRGAFVLEKLLLDLNGQELVPAYFIKPKSQSKPTATVLFNHSHGGFYSLGKDEVVHGNVYLQKKPYAEELATLGYSVLCIDHWGFGERVGRTESEIFKHMLWHGQVMWGMMVFDSIRAVDYLGSRDDVDSDRIGTLGMSMGSTMAWWLAALDDRIKVCVDICCLTDFQALIEMRNLDGHGIYYYVPNLLKYYTSADINALIAPRPHLSLAGTYDRLTPSAGLERIDHQLRDVYTAAGAADAWRLTQYPVGHFETSAMREEVLHFLDTWL